LLDIRPIEVVETVKRYGLKFLRITRKFESMETPKSYSDMVTFQNETIFNSIKIPSWFDADKLINEFSQRSIKNYEDDTEFKKAVEDLKKAERIGRPLLSFVQFVKHRFDSELDSYLETEAARFLRSNFPLSFYHKFVVFDNTFQEFLRVLEDRVRKYEFLARCSRSFDMYGKRINEMKAAISPLIDQIDACNLHCSRLKRYVIVWNAKDYAELKSPKFLDMTNLEHAEFERILNAYDNTLAETRRLLLRFDEDVLCKESDSAEYATRKVFSDLIALPSSSLKLKS
jgi:hypothetical protein